MRVLPLGTCHDGLGFRSARSTVRMHRCRGAAQPILWHRHQPRCRAERASEGIVILNSATALLGIGRAFSSSLVRPTNRANTVEPRLAFEVAKQPILLLVIGAGVNWHA